MKTFEICGIDITVETGMDVSVFVNNSGKTNISIKGRTIRGKKEKESTQGEDYMTVLEAIKMCRIVGQATTITGMAGRRIRMKHPRFEKIVEKMASEGFIEAFTKNKVTAYKMTAKGQKYVKTGIYYTDADVAE